MNDVSAAAQKSELLQSISAETLERLSPNLHYLDLVLGDHLYGPDEEINYIYFPAGAMISVVGVTLEGGSAEIGVMGSEGMAGFEVLMGGKRSPHEVMVQLPGGGVRLKALAAIEEFKRGGDFHNSLLEFVRKFMLQIGQNVVCNRLHSLEERLSKWLLMCADRYRNDNLPLTQEFLALMAGATRASVTLTAIALRDIGYITYSRGKVTILDRPGLESFSCNCYQTMVEGYRGK